MSLLILCFGARRWATWCLLGAVAGYSAAAAPEANPLSAERWKTWPLVVAPSQGDSLLRAVYAAIDGMPMRQQEPKRTTS